MLGRHENIFLFENDIIIIKYLNFDDACIIKCEGFGEIFIARTQLRIERFHMSDLT